MFKESNTIEERFWKYVDKKGEDECWNWKSAKAGSRDRLYGYLYVGHEGRRSVSEYAHHLSYKINIGKIPDGIWVLHKCDNPLCVNPKHLFLGTAKDNTGDMIKKGRQSMLGRYPKEHYLSKKDIDEMLLDFKDKNTTIKKMSEKYQCCAATIERICHDRLGPDSSRIGMFNKLSESDIVSIRQQYASGIKKQCELAQEFGVHYSHISLIVRGKRH